MFTKLSNEKINSKQFMLFFLIYLLSGLFFSVEL